MLQEIVAERRMEELPATGPLDAQAIGGAVLRLRELVRARGLRWSAARETIAKMALETTAHFSVDELVVRLRERGHVNIHAATVYRILPVLIEAGLVRFATLSAEPGVRYERGLDRPWHGHLVCVRCRRVVEFRLGDEDRVRLEAAARFGFDVTAHVHELHGVCGTCAAASPEEP